MQEIFFTILVIWVLFRIFGRTSVAHNYTFTQNNYHKNEEKKREEVRIEHIEGKDKKKKNDDDGEYVDYEEVK